MRPLLPPSFQELIRYISIILPCFCVIFFYFLHFDSPFVIDQPVGEGGYQSSTGYWNLSTFSAASPMEQLRFIAGLATVCPATTGQRCAYALQYERHLCKGAEMNAAQLPNQFVARGA